MTVTVEHDHQSLVDQVPMYRCHCGLLHRSTQSAHECRHRLRRVPLTPDRHEPAQLTLEAEDAR